MNNNLFLDLVRKDLVLYRGMVLVAMAVGAVSVFMITQGDLMFYLGSVAAMCAFIILTIFLVQFGILMERKERVHYFVLSLPITGRQYLLAKLVAMWVAFLLPFLLTSAVALLLMASYPPSRGFIPFALTVLLYFPMYFSVLVSATAISKGEAANITLIIFFNIAVNLLIAGLLRLPSVGATISGAETVWVPELQMICAIELAVTALAPLLALQKQHHKLDLV